jgi:hypothetical protein
MYPHVRQFETIDNLRRELRASTAEGIPPAHAPGPKRGKSLFRRRRGGVCTAGC